MKGRAPGCIRPVQYPSFRHPLGGGAGARVVPAAREAPPAQRMTERRILQGCNASSSLSFHPSVG